MKRCLPVVVFGLCSSAPLFAQDEAESTAAAKAAELDTISVIGEGETRQVQSLGRLELQRRLPGSSPLKAMSKLPGVNFTASDPFGAYEWSARISVRGFSQNQLGFTLDGIPLGDMSYGNHNGMHISRALISEQLDRVEMAQGAGATSTASSSNLGGTAQFFSRAPAVEPGLRFAQMLGSDAARRSLLSLDTGERRGFSAWLAAVDSVTDKWKGAGEQQQRQFNAKALYQGEFWSLTGYFASSRRREADYMDLSLESQQRLGWDWDYYQPDWQRAIDAARGQYRGAVNSLDDAYYLGRGLRDDDLAALTFDWQVNDVATVRLQGYRHDNQGQGHWATPYTPSSAELPISIRTTEYAIDRHGLMPSLNLLLGAHSIDFGVWQERNRHDLQRNFYYLDGPPDAVLFFRNPDLRVFHQRYDIASTQYWLTDRIDLLDGRLTVDLGFKGSEVEVEAQTFIGSLAQGRIVADDGLLPQAGLRWGLVEGSELFASYTENLAAFRAGVTGPFSASQVAFDAFADGLQPETSTTVEFGLRRSSERYLASLAVYAVDFENRLLQIARCTGIVGCPSSFANVGDVRTTGLEATLVWRWGETIEWFNSLSLNRSRYRADYLDGDRLIATDGRHVIDAPERLFSSELSYRRDGFDAYLGGKYTDERYVTYLNDSRVDGFWLFDAGAGYQWDEVGALASLRLSLQVSNLLDERYFSSVGTNGFVASDPDGLNYTLHAGAPRQWFVSLDLRF